MSSAVIFESPLVKPFNNSNTVAIAASIGIHALVLGLAFPYLSATSSKGSSDQTDVRLVELTPAEQSRLPNLSPPTPEISQFSNPSLENTPLLDTPTIDPTQIPPSIDSFASTSSFPSLPPLEGLQSAPSLPPLPSIPQMNVYSPPIASLPAPSQNLPAPPQLRSPQRYQEQETPFREENIRPNFPQTDDEFTLDELKNSPIVYGNQRQQEITQQQETAALSNPRRIDPSLEEERQRRLRAELIENAQRLQQSLQPDSTNTSSDEATKNFSTWISQNNVQQGFTQGIRKEHLNMRINGNYPTIASGRQIEGTSVYGVVVDASGRPVDVQPLQSAGYPILDKQAKEDILRQAFQNPTGGKQSYVISVSYKDPNPTRNLPQPVNNQRQTTPSRQTTPTTPTAAPSSQPVQPVTQPSNRKPETQITQPTNNQDNQRPNTPPVVEQSPTPDNLKPETQVEEPANEAQQNQLTAPVVEQSPVPENIKPETISEPQNTPSSNPPSPSVAEPPAAPASQKPNPPAQQTVSPPTSQKPTNPNVAPLGDAAPKKPTTPTPEAQNRTSNNPSGT